MVTGQPGAIPKGRTRPTRRSNNAAKGAVGADVTALGSKGRKDSTAKQLLFEEGKKDDNEGGPWNSPLEDAVKATADILTGGGEKADPMEEDGEEGEERLAREAAKKSRADGRREERATSKAQTEEASGGEMQDNVEEEGGTVEDLNDNSNGRVDGSDSDDDNSGSGESEGERVLNTPPGKRRKASSETKKKARKERKAARKKKEKAGKSKSKKGKRKVPEEDQGEDPDGRKGDAPGTPSSMRTGRFSHAGNTPGRAPTAKTRPALIHQHKRIYAEGSRELKNEDDPHTEFTMAIRLLVKEAQKVDETFVLAPAREDNEEPTLYTPNEVSTNHTDLQKNVTISQKARFTKQKPWGRGNEDVPDDELISPVVDFNFVFHCNEDPGYIIGNIYAEWNRHGGRKLRLTELETSDPKAAIALWMMYNKTSEATIIEEAKNFLSVARDMEAEDSPDFRWGEKDIPSFYLSRWVPNLPGQDTSKMQSLPYKMKEARKALHIVSDRRDVLHLQELMKVAKERGLVKTFWGPEVSPSNVVVTKKADLADGQEVTPAYVIHNMKSYTRRHVNYQDAMNPVGFPGIWDLDAGVEIFSVTDPTTVVSTTSLRKVLYANITMEDGYPLIGELHQLSPLAVVEALVSNAPEAEVMVGQMQKNVAAYLWFYLLDQGMPEEFIRRLLDESCDPTLIRATKECTWDKATRVLTTPADEEEAQKAKLEEAAWYVDAFGEVMDSPKKGKKKGKGKQTNPEDVYNLGDDHSVKTLHERPGKTKKGYGGSPGVPTFQVGRKTADGKGVTSTESIDLDSDMEVEGGTISLNQLSKEELIQRLQRLSTGSAPASGMQSHSMASDEEHSGEESSSSGESSYSSDSDSSVESVKAKDGTPG